MLPVARKPIVQYVAEELIANKIDQILFVTGRNKTSIENHFGINAQSKTVVQMTELFEMRHASCVVAVEEVPLDQTMHYGIVKVEPGEGDFFRVINVVEKPKPGQAPSRLAIAGRYVFSPLIF